METRSLPLAVLIRNPRWKLRSAIRVGTASGSERRLLIPPADGNSLATARGTDPQSTVETRSLPLAELIRNPQWRLARYSSRHRPAIRNPQSAIESLAPERHQWINLRRASRREIASQQRDAGEQQ